MRRSSRIRAVKSTKSPQPKVARRKRAKPKRAKPPLNKPALTKPTRTKPKRTARKSASRSKLPIELYYWPTPNGWKISIMLEECGLPYVVRPVDISKGEQFSPQFLAISPNNRMPAILDPNGPGGRPISVFESGAILQYLGRKTGQFYPRDERARVAVDEWLFWQMGGLGPMAGQANHFRRYAPEKIAYAIDRYTNEVNRLFGVMNTRLASREFLAGRYSIADMACVGWVRLAERMGQELAQFPHLKRWFETVRARPAVKRAFAIRVEAASAVDMKDPNVRAILFGQTAR
jgi:GST-like protein